MLCFFVLSAFFGAQTMAQMGSGDMPMIPVISSLSINEGSMQGGTRLTITGSNFTVGQDAGTNDSIFVGPYECPVIDFLSSTSQLVCDTVPAIYGPITDEDVYVVSAAGDVATFCCFTISDDSTPQIVVLPLAAFPGSELQVLLRDYTSTLDITDETQLEYIKVGQFRCNQQTQYDGTWATRVQYNGDSNWYQINCTLPDGSTGDVEVGAGVSGQLSVEVKTKLGLGQPADGALLYDTAGNPYMLEMLPKIIDVSPAGGSVAGGTPLTVMGSGFPVVDNESGRGTASDVVITVDGHACTVLKSNFTHAICLTGAGDTTAFLGAYAAGTYTSDSAELPPSYWGFYPATSLGIQWYYWQRNSSTTFSQHDALALATGAVSDWTDASILYSGFEMPDRYFEKTLPTNDSAFGARVVSFFEAPVDGPYRFMLAADDVGALYGTVMQTLENGTVWLNRTLLATTPYVPFRTFDSYPQQLSAPVFLSQGDLLLLEAAYVEYGGGDYLTLGVQIPSDVYRPDSIGTAEVVTLEFDDFGEVYSFDALWSTAEGAATPNGTLSLTVGEESASVPWNADPSTFRTALASLLLDITVDQLRVDRVVLTEPDVNATGFRWHATLDTQVFSGPLSTGALVFASGVDMVGDVVRISYNRTRSSSLNIGGQFDMSFPVDPSTIPGYVDASINVDSEISARDLRLGLLLLPGIGAGTQVTTSIASIPNAQGLPRTQLQYLIEFNPVDNPGQQPLFVLHNYLNGTNVTLSIDYARDASPTRVVYPIPPDLLRAPLAAPESLRVAVRGSAAPQCVRDDGTICTFDYKNSLTPVVASCAPHAAKAGDTLTITGENFGSELAAAVVRVGDTACVPTAVTTTTILCTVGEGGWAGRFVPEVGIDGKGLAMVVNPDSSYIDLSILTLDSATPSMLNEDAVVILELAGKGFQGKFSVPSDLTVTVGDSCACAVVNATVTNLTCVLDVHACGLAIGFYPVTISLESALYDANGNPLYDVLPPTAAFVKYRRRKALQAIEWNHTETVTRVDLLRIVSDAISVSLPSPSVSPVGGDTLSSSNGNANCPQGFQRFPAYGAPLSLNVTLAGSGLTVESIQLEPSILNPPADERLYNLWNAEGYACEIVGSEYDASSDTATITCDYSAIPRGFYDVHVTFSDGSVRLSPCPIEVVLEILQISPFEGSLAGGTVVTLSGSGFPYGTASAVANGMEAVVAIGVNVSTTFPSGIVLCDVLPLQSTRTAVVCRTREHAAASASPADPSARNLLYVPTQPRTVELTLCPGSLSDDQKTRCWSMGSTPRALCRGSDPRACTYSYTVAQTPVVFAAVDNDQPRLEGDQLTLSGVQLGNITFVSVDGKPCTDVSVNATATAVTCTLPGLPSGIHRVRAWQADGQYAIMDPNNGNRGISVFYAAIIGGIVSESGVPDTISPYFGSLAGGKRVILRDFQGPGFTADRPDLISVQIGSQAASVLSVTDREVTIETPSIMGRVKLLYYTQRYGSPSTWLLPEPESADDIPQAVTTSPGFSMSWGNGGPVIAGQGQLQSDYFGARFVGYILANQTGNFTFELYSDDNSRLWIDGRKIIDTTAYRVQNATIMLQQGFHYVMSEFVEFTGAAFTRLHWKPPGASQLVEIPPSNVFIEEPGQPAQVTMYSNGVRALSACAYQAQTVPNEYALILDPLRIDQTAGTGDGLHIGSYPPPLPPTPAPMPAPMPAPAPADNQEAPAESPTFPDVPATEGPAGVPSDAPADGPTADAPATATAVRRRLLSSVTDDSSLGARRVLLPYQSPPAVRACAIVPSITATPVFNWAALFDATDSVTHNVSALQIAAGVRLSVKSQDLVLKTGPPSLLSAVASDIQVSISGDAIGQQAVDVTGTSEDGTTLTLPRLPVGTWTMDVYVTDFGFALGPGLLRDMPIVYSLDIASVAPRQGSAYGGHTVSVQGSGFISADYPSTSTFYMNYFFNEAPIVPQNLAASSFAFVTPPRGSNDNWNTFSFRYMTNTSPYPQSAASMSYSYDDTWTPALVSYSTLDTESNSGGAAAFAAFKVLGSWIPPSAMHFNASNASHVAAVSLAILSQNPSGIDIVAQCPMTRLSATDFEAACDPLPSGVFDVRVLVSLCGLSSPVANTLEIPYAVHDIAPLQGSYGGGQLITLTGSGFNQDAMVVFGNANASCAIVSVTQTQIVCSAPALLPAPLSADATDTVSISLQSSAYSTLDQLPGFVYVYKKTLTPVIMVVSPGRGSSQGGTALTLFGTNLAGVTSVMMGGLYNCTIVGVPQDTQVTCLTANPSPVRPYGHLPIEALDPSMGVAAPGMQAAVSGLVYEYADLWSRNSTWGGENPPIDGDSVHVPADQTVVLDVSSPMLRLVIIEGELRFDPEGDPEQEIALLAEQILLINGGRLKIGDIDAPYPAKARITLSGDAYNSIELPQYGAKAIAVRQGQLILNGQPRLPTWTLLRETVDVGANTIWLEDRVNWRIGDEIAIASSSVLPGDTDTAFITAVDFPPEGGSRLTLDRAMSFTHLGELVTDTIGAQPWARGNSERVPYGSGLDMRAEVIVLTRDILIEGDEHSVDQQFGGQIMMNRHMATMSNQIDDLNTFIHAEQTEFFRMGQAFRLGRYAVHLHLHGESPSTKFLGNAFHRTYNRAVALHASHFTTVRDNVAYDVMGHTYFLEDGIEEGHVFDNNVAIWTRSSSSLLNSDVFPASFWITNPNNFYSNNRAAGSEGYGFWFELPVFPTGPSTTTLVCPRKQALGLFVNNTAHSNLLYGLRIFPEWQPHQYFSDRDRLNCAYSGTPSFNTTLSEYTGYKNGMKGAIATQVGVIRFVNFTIFDNGAGPYQHVVNGKDNGGGIEMTWIIDQRSRAQMNISDYAGIIGAIVVSRTQEGQQGSAGYWPRANRGVRGVLGVSTEVFEQNNDMQISNVRFFNYTGGDYYALEHCPKCKSRQGGFSAHLTNVEFIPPVPETKIAVWSYQHEGLFVDGDGSFLGAAGRAIMPWNDLYSLEDCQETDADWNLHGGLCEPTVRHRRFMLNNHQPYSIKYFQLMVTRLNKTTYLDFSNYNAFGYQFNVPSGGERTYELAMNVLARTDLNAYNLHGMENLYPEDYVYFESRSVHDFQGGWTLNGGRSLELDFAPNASSPHGSYFYNHDRSVNPRDNVSDTVLTYIVQGNVMSSMYWQARLCPDAGCVVEKPPAINVTGAALWSDPTIWPGGVLPADGANLTIGAQADITLDISTARLDRLFIQGNLTFLVNTSATDPIDIALFAKYVIVDGGRLTIGSADAPYPHTGTIRLLGSRTDGTDQGIAISNTLDLGSKVVAVINGGSVDLHGAPARRWTTLSEAAEAGATQLVLQDTPDGWNPGARVVIASTSFNPREREIRTITAVSGRVVLLDTPLLYNHSYVSNDYEGKTLTIAPEVGLLDSNVLVTADDGPVQYDLQNPDPNQLRWGARVLVNGAASALRISSAAVHYCGQAFYETGCIEIDQVGGEVYVEDSAVAFGMDTNVRIMRASANATVQRNVLVDTLDAHQFIVDDTSVGNAIVGNLALGTTKFIGSKSSFDTGQIWATFLLMGYGNELRDNVAAGSDRAGYDIRGDPCDVGQPLITGNTAHSSLAGMIIRSNPTASCTLLTDLTLVRNWDFGLISLLGIETDLVMRRLTVADHKHAGVLILKKSDMDQSGRVDLQDSLIVGHSTLEACNMCTAGFESTCHSALSVVSYTDPMQPTVGLLSSTFALEFTTGPEHKPWDHVHGYATVLGSMFVTGTTFADFRGSNVSDCKLAAHAIGNHELAPDAFHPHFFSQSSVVNVATDGLFRIAGPDPAWMNEADCGFATITRDDGSLLHLNCAGPKHVYFRDTDGSLTGNIGTVLGSYVEPRAYRQDQGTNPLQFTGLAFSGGSAAASALPGSGDGPCRYRPEYEAYMCYEGFDVAATRPKGTMGDPQLFVLESLDPDTEDRNFSPVKFMYNAPSGAGVLMEDYIVTAMDQGWCFGYTCEKRLSTFWTNLPTGHHVKVNFTGTPATFFRAWLPYADAASELTLELKYFDVLRRFTWTENTLRIEPLTQPPVLGDGNPHGSYYWNQSLSTLFVKMLGGQSVELRTERVVQVNMRLALTIDQFYADQFVANLASLLLIDPSRIRVAQAVPGSVVLTTYISEPLSTQNAPLPTRTFFDPNSANNVGSPLPPAPPPPPPTTDPAALDLNAIKDALTTAVNTGAFATHMNVTVLGYSAVLLNVPDIAPPATTPPPPSPGKSGASTPSALIGIVVGVVGGICVVAAVAFIVVRSRKDPRIAPACAGGISKQHSLKGVTIEPQNSLGSPRVARTSGHGAVEFPGGGAAPAMELPPGPPAPIQHKKSLKKALSTMFKWQSGDVKAQAAEEEKDAPSKALVDYFKQQPSATTVPGGAAPKSQPKTPGAYSPTPSESTKGVKGTGAAAPGITGSGFVAGPMEEGSLLRNKQA